MTGSMMERAILLQEAYELLCKLQDEVEQVCPEYYYSSDLIAQINDLHKRVDNLREEV